jgi:DNA-binding response OmpR family regulator
MNERARILIVDDEPFNVDYLEQELEDLGYETASAVNGQEALDQVAAQAPDLVLLDVMMPVMNGFEVCQRLKENEETRLIPVVIMTALDGLEDRIRGIEAGADDFLTKPVNHRELVARIQTALRLKQALDRQLAQARRVRDHFAKFVPEPMRRLVDAGPEGAGLGEKQEQEVSVLFLDISGYSRLSEQVPLRQLNALVERYFSAFLDRIRETGADINETAGDGFMAVFQDQDPARHARRAAEAALAILEEAARLNRENSSHPLQVHMGINSGLALVGATRFEGARGTRWTFTASGPATNLAARLAGVAEAGQVLVGPETARHLQGKYALESLGRERLKNISGEVEVYRVVGAVV